MTKKLKIFAALVLAGYLAVLTLVFIKQRTFLFFPSHYHSEQLGAEAGLERWVEDGEYLGMRKVVPDAERVWLFLHGNGGQAAGRKYVMSFFQPRDSVYVLEYPGYGGRPGTPSASSFNAAALHVYNLLERRYGSGRLCVL